MIQLWSSHSQPLLQSGLNTGQWIGADQVLWSEANQDHCQVRTIQLQKVNLKTLIKKGKWEQLKWLKIDQQFITQSLPTLRRSPTCMIHCLLQLIMLLIPATLIPREICHLHGEPSNTNIMKILQNMHISLNTKLDLLKDIVESLKGDVFDLQQENALLKAQLDSRGKKIWKHRSRKWSSVLVFLERSGLKGVKSILSGTSNFFSSRSQLILLSQHAEKSKEKALKIVHNKLGLRYTKPEHWSSPPSCEEGCRQDKAYPCKVCVEKDVTGCDQEQMKVKQFRPKSSHCWLDKTHVQSVSASFRSPWYHAMLDSRGKSVYESKVYKTDNLSDLHLLSTDDAPDTSMPAGAAMLHWHLDNMRNCCGNQHSTHNRWDIFPSALSHDADLDKMTKKNT